MTQEEKFIYMTQTPVPKLVSSLAAPTIVSMLITSFYNMADTFFVGKINTSATAAVGVVFSLMALIQAVGFFCGHGSGNYISRKLGGKEVEDASTMAATGFFTALFAGCAIMAGGLLFLRPLACLLGSTDTILPYAMDYLRIILIGAPCMTASIVLNNQMRFQGSAVYAMVGIVAGAALNIGLDPLFIFTLDMGIAGAALATVISQFISFLLLWVGIKKSGNLAIRWRNANYTRYYMGQIFQGGIPSLCRQGLASIGVVILNHAAGSVGNDAAIAAMSIVSRVSMFANSALIGFGQGFQPVCGFNYGAGLYQRVREGFWFCVKYAALFLAAVSVLGIFFAPQTIALFRKDDAQVIAIGTYAMRMVWLTFPLGAWIVLCNMMLQSCGRAVPASILSSAKQGLFFVPLILLLSFAFGLRGIQISQPIADLCTFFLAIPLGGRFLRDMDKE